MKPEKIYEEQHGEKRANLYKYFFLFERKI